MSTITSKEKNIRRAISGRKVPSFRTVWASLQETREMMRESDERFKQEMKENAERFEQEKKEDNERFERQKKEDNERFERQIKETNKQLGKLGNRFGEVIEYMVVPNLIQKFHDMGFVFDKVHHQTDIEDRENKIFTELDISLENGDKVMIVEVKSKPKTEDIAEHIERMEKVRLHADLHGDKRTFLGAIASMVFSDNVKQFALKNGFYVIEPSGETFIITAPEGEYSPREW